LRWAVRGGVGYVAETLYGKRLHDRKLALSFDTGAGGERVLAEGAQIVARVLTRSNLPAREIARLNRRRYVEIAKAELAQAARALRERDGTGFWRGARNAWNYQVQRAGLNLFPLLIWDALKLWRKQKQGRIKYVFDIE